jgi:hypothetical protein
MSRLLRLQTLRTVANALQRRNQNIIRLDGKRRPARRPPISAGGGYPVCTGPTLENHKQIQKLFLLFDFSMLDCSGSAALAGDIGRTKLCTNCKFCMISVALIPVVNYYA